VLHIANDLALRTEQAIRATQASGQLPEFDAPPVKVSRANRPDVGDYACPVALQLGHQLAISPGPIAAAIIAHFPKPEYLSAIDQRQGYINFRLAENWLQRQVDEILRESATGAQGASRAGQRVQVECISANPTGPLTVGRIRGGIIGDTLARLLRAQGYQVELEYYYNNAGRQMQILAESLRSRYLERLGLPSSFPAEGYRGDYLYTIADELIAERGDGWAEVPDLQPFRNYAETRIMSMIRAALERINIRFDSYFNETWLYEDGAIWRTLDRLAEKGLVYEAARPLGNAGNDEAAMAEEAEATTAGPAVWLKTRELRGTDQDRALVKSDGQPTYRLPDIAYHINKLERGFDVLINILGADHLDQYPDVIAAVGALGYEAGRIRVVIHQFVTLTEAGETRRMSTRRGEYVALDELLNDVGSDVVRFFMLEKSPDSHIGFDLALARKQSDENPAYYIQNAHVRCASIARVAAERGISADGGDVSLLTQPLELAWIRKMLELPEIVDQSVEMMSPHPLAHWAHRELARLFHRTYEEVRALHTDVPDDLAGARLKLYAAAAIMLARVLDLMGMSAPETM
jgi:arginyl-tRNA synthetase